MEMTVAGIKSAPETAANSQENNIQEMTDVFIGCLPSFYAQAMHRLANAAGLDLRALARPHLEELGKLTGETATLSVPGEHEALTLDFVQSPLSVRSVAEVGRTSVAHATAVGKVFLTHGGKLPDGALTAFTERTIVDRAVLEVEVATTRDRGWGQALGEREEDLNAVATPVCSRAGQLVAILGVQGPAVRFNPRAMRSAAELLLERAALISSTL